MIPDARTTYRAWDRLRREARAGRFDRGTPEETMLRALALARRLGVGRLRRNHPDTLLA